LPGPFSGSGLSSGATHGGSARGEAVCIDRRHPPLCSGIARSIPSLIFCGSRAVEITDCSAVICFSDESVCCGHAFHCGRRSSLAVWASSHSRFAPPAEFRLSVYPSQLGSYPGLPIRRGYTCAIEFSVHGCSFLSSSSLTFRSRFAIASGLSVRSISSPAGSSFPIRSGLTSSVCLTFCCCNSSFAFRQCFASGLAVRSGVFKSSHGLAYRGECTGIRFPIRRDDTSR
jgi:hypothetical protein